MTERMERKSPPALIAAAWLVVTVPTMWGLTYTVRNALKIFSAGSAPVSAPAAPVSSPK